MAAPRTSSFALLARAGAGASHAGVDGDIPDGRLLERDERGEIRATQSAASRFDSSAASRSAKSETVTSIPSPGSST